MTIFPPLLHTLFASRRAWTSFTSCKAPLNKMMFAESSGRGRRTASPTDRRTFATLISLSAFFTRVSECSIPNTSPVSPTILDRVSSSLLLPKPTSTILEPLAICSRSKKLSECSSTLWVFQSSHLRFSTREIDDEVPKSLMLIPSADSYFDLLQVVILRCDLEIAAYPDRSQ